MYKIAVCSSIILTLMQSAMSNDVHTLTSLNNALSQLTQLEIQLLELTVPSGVIIHLLQGDITQVKNIDAIVNAANQNLAHGGGVCGSIFNAAGDRWGSKKLQEACNVYTKNGPIGIGEARVTPSFELEKNGIKKIIHAVGPDCRVITDRKQQKEYLSNAYSNSLKLAQDNGMTSIAFPFISSAIYACEPDFAAETALNALVHFSYEKNKITHVYIVLWSKQDLELFKMKLTEYKK